MKTFKSLKSVPILFSLLVSSPARAEGWVPAWADFTPVREQPSLLIGVLGIILVWGYYRMAQFLFRRYPSAGQAQTTSLSELPPALIRYLMIRQIDEHCVTAALISMAEKGAITIEEQHRTFVLGRTRAGQTLLSPDEAALFASLFEGREEIQLRSDAYDRILGSIPHSKDHRWQERVRLASQIERATRVFARALKRSSSPRYVNPLDQ